MSREISIFADYKQHENSTTNYCGLMMKLLYEESPKLFEEFLYVILQPYLKPKVGPSFKQQDKQAKSIPDLSIIQNSYSIFFETKIGDWFYSKQIEKHLNGLGKNADIKALILLSNFEFDPEKKYDKEIKRAQKKNIIIKPLSFEEFVNSLQVVCHSENLANLLEEFKLYLDRKDLWPKWKYLLDVVNCAGSQNEVNQNVYMCPTTGASYSHRRAKYFGSYSNKIVDKVFEITANVIIEPNRKDVTIQWKNSSLKDSDVKREALNKINLFPSRLHENLTTPIQMFILNNGFNTSFMKESKGGMFTSKQYFWDIAEDCKGSQDLANKLNGRNWGEFLIDV